MNARFLGEAAVLGAVAGMRSMAGLATLALRRQGAPTKTLAAMAVGEMLVDKTPLVGPRIAPMPLAGRALSGALVGGVIAYDMRENLVVGAIAGAAAATIAAHLAFYARKHAPLSRVMGGMLEDAIVLSIAGVAASQRPRRRLVAARAA